MYLRQGKSKAMCCLPKNVAQSLMSLMQKRRDALEKVSNAAKVRSMLYFRQILCAKPLCGEP
jgi:hypothetical protein